MKKFLYLVFPFTIILGSLLIAIHAYEINGFSIISAQTTNIGTFRWTYYTIDLHQYLLNLQNTLIDKNITGLYVEFPTIPNQPTDVLTGIIWIGNMILLLLNTIAYLLNWVVIVPTKILLYPTNIVLSIFGLNTGNNNWVNAVALIYDWQIPYIPYIPQ